MRRHFGISLRAHKFGEECRNEETARCNVSIISMKSSKEIIPENVLFNNIKKYKNKETNSVGISIISDHE